MYENKTIAVVVPAYNEETQIGMVIENMPQFVDRIVIVNDGSKDNTHDVVSSYIGKDNGNQTVIPWRKKIKSDSVYDRADVILEEMREQEEKKYAVQEIYNDNEEDRIVLIEQQNSGVGSAIATGYKWCRDHNIDCTAVMAGDGQMDPAELEDIIRPVCQENIDYVKGNRLSHKAAKIMMPKQRHFGNSVLSLLTKIASGYWNVSDTQTGYTAISNYALNMISLYDIYPSYGCPNDILIKLNIENCTIREIPIKPVYAVGEQSKMKIFKVIPTVSLLLVKGFFKRIVEKYFKRSFHPLFLFYMAGIGMAVLNIPFIIKIIIDVLIKNGSVAFGYYMVFILLTLFSFQSIGFAMWMDIQDNEKLST